MNDNLKVNIEKAKYIAEETILLYSDNSPLKLCILGIPTLGPIIDTIISTKGQNISYQRLLDFYNQLDREVKAIDERLIDLEYINSEDFFDLLIEVTKASMKTRHQEKKALFAKIVKSACTKELEDTNPEFYLDVIDELTIEEILVAKKMYEFRITNQGEFSRLAKQFAGDRDISITDSDVLTLSGLQIPKEDYPFILLRLQRVGLIKEQVGVIMGYHGGSYEITDTFKKMMRIILNN